MAPKAMHSSTTVQLAIFNKTIYIYDRRKKQGKPQLTSTPYNMLQKYKIYDIKKYYIKKEC